MNHVDGKIRGIKVILISLKNKPKNYVVKKNS